MKLTFFPWVRQGLAAAIGNAGAAARPNVMVKVQVQHESNPAQSIDVGAELYGPGDVLALDRAAVIRTWPVSGGTIVDDQLAAIEFDRPDLPWQFSPQSASGDRLLPWLQLVVVEPVAGVSLDERPGQNAVLRLTGAAVVAAQLPRPDEAGSFAHAQLAAATNTDLEAELRDNPLRSSSRLLAARKLEKGKKYVACLVPTFELGRRAGLGEPTDGAGTGLAWATTAAEVELPVYFHWRFECSTEGGFLEQAKKLTGQADTHDAERPGELGRRTTWAAPAPSLAKGFSFEVPSLFRSMSATDKLAVPAAAADAKRFETAITSLQGKARTLTPPKYGAAHAPDGAWLDAINRNPALRAIAGLGTQVVQQQQEELVAAVWSKLDADTPPANAEAAKTVRQAVMARLVGAQSQVKTSPEIAGRLAWSSTRFAGLAETATASLATPGTTARVTAPAATIASQPPAAMLPAIRRLATIAGRVSQLTRLSRPPPPPPPTPGIATFEGGKLMSPMSVAAAHVDAAPPAPRFVLVDEQAAFPLGNATFTLQLVRIGGGGGTGGGGGGGGGPRVPPRAVLLRAARRPGGDIDVPDPDDPPTPPSGPAAHKTVVVHEPVAWHLDQIKAGLADNAAAAEFRAAARAVQLWLDVPAPQPKTFPHVFTFAAVLAKLRDSASVLAEARLDFGVMGTPPPTPAPPIVLDFPENALGVRYPMWQTLHDLDPQAVLAHDDEIGMNRAALLELNPEAHEAFLVGLNHELLREVRWRKMPVVGAPTFFDSVLSEFPEVKPLDQWGAKDNVALIWRSIPILLVRAELIRAQPRLSVYARSEPPAGPSGVKPAPNVVPPMFSGQLDESTRFYGFGIRQQDLFDPKFSWRFVFEEQPTEPCFRTPTAATPGQLRASAFGPTGAAAIASSFLKKPLRAVLLATDLFPRKTP